MKLAVLLLAFLLFALSSFSQNSEKEGSIPLKEGRLNYKIIGKGTPTLVLGSSIYYPRTFSSDIQKNLQLYFIDLPWFAKGYKIDSEDLSLDYILETIEQARKHLQLENPLVMGHSIHGTIATEYTKVHQDKILGLIVIGSPAQWGNSSYDTKAAALWSTASETRKAIQEENGTEVTEIERLTGQKEASARYNNMSPQYFYDPTYDATWLWEDMTVHSHLTSHLFAEVFMDYDMFASDLKINIPMLVVLGRHDYVIPYTLWESSYPQVPNFELYVLPKSGHTPQLEQPKEFNEILFSWLSKNSF